MCFQINKKNKIPNSKEAILQTAEFCWKKMFAAKCQPAFDTLHNINHISVMYFIYILKHLDMLMETKWNKKLNWKTFSES